MCSTSCRGYSLSCFIELVSLTIRDYLFQKAAPNPWDVRAHQVKHLPKLWRQAVPLAAGRPDCEPSFFLLE